MSKRAWLTPDVPTELLCRRVLVPDTLIYAFNGAIGNLGDVWNWDAFGGLTEGEAASLGFDVFCSIEDCELDKRMIGSIQFYAADLPTGVLLCDGQAYNEVDYPDLYTALGGVGGVFNVPNLLGKFIVGAGGAYAVGDTGGADTHTLTIAEMPAHTHPSETNIEDVDLEGVGVPLPAAGVSFPSPTGSTGGGDAHNNMPPYVALLPGIIALPVVISGGGASGVEMAVVADEKPLGTHGGGLYAGVWTKRDLNTVRVSASWLSLSGDEITLSDGNYFMLATLPVRDTVRHQGRILKTSDNTVYVGQSSRSNSMSVVMAGVSVVGSETFRIEHRSSVDNVNQGAGQGSSFGVETFVQLLVVKYG